MGARIVISLTSAEAEELLENCSAERLGYLFADALAEFRHPRRDAETYVAKRYPLGYLSNRDKKVKEVIGRVCAAEILHNPVLQLKIVTSGEEKLRLLQCCDCGVDIVFDKTRPDEQRCDYCEEEGEIRGAYLESIATLGSK